MAVLSTLQCRALGSGTECRHTGGVNREFTLVGEIQGRAFMPDVFQFTGAYQSGINARPTVCCTFQAAYRPING